jgi:hypothetical protein
MVKNRLKDHLKKYFRIYLFTVPAILFFISISAFLFYVKDDAYITFRFSRNLVKWGEISFNKGLKVEGYTNFLWMVLLSIPVVLGLDQLLVAKVFSTFFSLGAIIFIWRFHNAFFSDKKESLTSGLWSASIFASSTSFALWTMSGLENGLFMFLVTGGVYYLFSSKRDFASIFLTLSCLTRPEGHLFLVFGGLYVFYLMLKKRGFDKKDIIWFAVPFVSLGLYHIFRYFYFGSLMPNTFLVKGSPNLSDVFRFRFDNGIKIEGTSIDYLKGLLNFNLNRFFLFLSVFALIPFRKEEYLKVLFCFAVVASFFAYHIKIGKDSMIFYRLFLPALPFMIILAVEGFKNIFRMIPYNKHFRGYLYLFPAVIVIPFSYQMISHTWSGSNDYLRDYIEKSERSHQALGHYLNLNSNKNETVLFQDMGGTPYIAKEIRFFDPIGVVEPWMGKELSKIKYNPFLRTEKMRTSQGVKDVREFSIKFQKHIFKDLKPERIAFIAYSPKFKGKLMSQTLLDFNEHYFRNRNVRPDRFSDSLVLNKEDLKTVESFFARSLKNNRYYHGLYSNPRFKEEYQLESYWRRTEHYWIVLFKRKL